MTTEINNEKQPEINSEPKNTHLSIVDALIEGLSKYDELKAKKQQEAPNTKMDPYIASIAFLATIGITHHKLEGVEQRAALAAAHLVEERRTTAIRLLRQINPAPDYVPTQDEITNQVRILIREEEAEKARRSYCSVM
jgi:hypothetical protein